MRGRMRPLTCVNRPSIARRNLQALHDFDRFAREDREVRMAFEHARGGFVVHRSGYVIRVVRVSWTRNEVLE